MKESSNEELLEAILVKQTEAAKNNEELMEAVLEKVAGNDQSELLEASIVIQDKTAKAVDKLSESIKGIEVAELDKKQLTSIKRSIDNLARYIKEKLDEEVSITVTIE